MRREMRAGAGTPTRAKLKMLDLFFVDNGAAAQRALSRALAQTASIVRSN